MPFGVGLEAQTSCTACKRVLQVNGLVDVVRCPDCGEQTPLDETLWRSALENISDVRRWVPGRARTHGTFGETRHLVVRRVRADPPLLHPAFAMEKAQWAAAATQGWLPDDREGCATVRAVPEPFTGLVSEGLFVVDEDPTTLAEAGERPPLPDASKISGLTAGCRSCGAAIDLQESGRIVQCEHCDTMAFVSDDLWARLHPDRRPRQFYLWLEGEMAPEPAPLDGEPGPLERLDSHRLPPVNPNPSDAACWVAFQLIRHCVRCHGRIPITAIVETIACPTCQATHSIPTEDWLSTILEACRDDDDDERDDDDESDDESDDDDDESPASGTQAAAMEAMAPNLHRGRRRDPPELDGRPLTAASARAAIHTDPAGDPNAEDATQPLIRAVPEPLATSLVPEGVELLVGEARGMISESLTRTGPGVDGVTFSCPQCGGTLAPDGRTRMIVCPSCDSGVGLPDEVWLRLHPVRAPWIWLLYDPRARVHEFEDVFDVAGGDSGVLFIVGRSAPWSEIRLCALDPSLRLLWFVDLGDCNAPRVSVRTSGDPLVWWMEEQQLTVRGVDAGGVVGQEHRVVVPSDVVVHDIDPSGRALGVRRERRARAQDHDEIVRIDLENGAVSPVWPVPVESWWRRLLRGLANGRRPPVEFATLGPRPPEIPQGARVSGGPDGSIALFDRSAFAVYDPAGDQPASVTVRGRIRVDRVGRCAAGWLIAADDDPSAALCLIGWEGAAKSLLPADARDRMVAGWPVRSADGSLSIVREDAFVLYDGAGELRFESWRAQTP